MTTGLSKRLFVALLIVPIMAGLITLGLRLPDLEGFRSAEPKPRPRAVIQNQIKKCKENFQQQELLALAARHPLPAIVLSLLPNARSTETVSAPQFLVVPKSSRAPPA